MFTKTYREFIEMFGIDTFLSVIEAGEDRRVHLQEHGVEQELLLVDSWGVDYYGHTEWLCDLNPEECTFEVWVEVEECGPNYPCDDIDAAWELYQEHIAQNASYETDEQMYHQINVQLGW